MPEIERLPGQTEGIGFVVPVMFFQPYTGWIADLVDSKRYGLSSSIVAENLLLDWLKEGPSNLSQLGIKGIDAKRLGYMPTKFGDVKEPTSCEVHECQPLKIRVYGMSAYRIDELVTLGLFGNTREKVAKRGVEDLILEKVRQDYSIVNFRAIGKN